MNFVGVAVLFFFLAANGALAVALMARAIAGIVNDFRINKEPNYNGAAECVSAAQER